MLKIRLMRIGANKKPFYRVVAVDERSKRTGAYIELLGTYNPLTEPKDIKLKQDRIDYWTKQGARMSNGFLRIIGKAPQRPPRKPKKEKKAKEPPALLPSVGPQPSEKAEEPIKETTAVAEKSDNAVIPTPSAPVIPSAGEESQDSKSIDPSLDLHQGQDDNKEESEKKDERSA